MSVTKKDVEWAAKLARLEFTENEKEELIEDLNKILDYVDKLNEIETDNEDIIVNPYYIENKFREDVVQQSIPFQDIVKNSPEHSEEYIVVPKVIGK